jgi:two-component system, cell cycle sensor histidine kinase and response regulator CckA
MGSLTQQGSATGDGQHLLELIVENIPYTIFVKSADELRYVFANKAGAELLGFPRDQILGKSDYDLFPADKANSLVSRDREALASGARVEAAEEQIFSRTSAFRYVHTKRVPIIGDRGKPRYLLVISEDITQLKVASTRLSLERPLETSEKMIAVGRLAAGIAHDFNNLLTVILGAGQTLLESIGADNPERDDAEVVVASAHRAAELTRQILAFSGHQVLQPRLLNVNAVVANIDRMLRRLIREDIDLLTVPEPDIWLVRAASGQLEQVIANLVVNARDAMPNGGTLTIATANVTLDERFASAHPGARPGPHVVLAVTDTGIGMSSEVKSQLFTPFFTTKPPVKGTGLGLSTVHDIVRQSRGFILVESEPGRGTTFDVYLPRALGVTDASADTLKPAATLHGNETILVVEDDATVRHMVAKVLRGYGYTVLSAPHAATAAHLAELYPGVIQLLVTDVVMPRVSGPELALQLTSVRPELRVLYVTGYTDDAVAHYGVLEAGVTLLQKPLTPMVLARTIREILDRNG